MSDATRLRLLHLLDGVDLSVAELATCLELAQPRVSTHLARLKEAGWVQDRRVGVSAFYRRAEAPQLALLDRLLPALDDAVLSADGARRQAVLEQRLRQEAWADQVAGDMERHYSPGRTWEALLQAVLPLLVLGDVLDLASGDGAVAELLAPRVRSLTCVDHSARVVAAARSRLAGHANVHCVQGDMHALHLADASFDQVLLLQALPYADPPAQVLSETARVLRPGGIALGTCLLAHTHMAITTPYGHRNAGLHPDELHQLAVQAGLGVVEIRSAIHERRPPQFRSLSFVLRRA